MASHVIDRWVCCFSILSTWCKVLKFGQWNCKINFLNSQSAQRVSVHDKVTCLTDILKLPQTVKGMNQASYQTPLCAVAAGLAPGLIRLSDRDRAESGSAWQAPLNRRGRSSKCEQPQVPNPNSCLQTTLSLRRRESPTVPLVKTI